MTPMNPQPLPDTLHGLIRTAIDDARGLNRRKYKPRCDEWHCPDEDGRCEVCLAGSILAGTLQCSPKKNYAPWEFPDKLQHKLEALEAVRSGSWLEAYRLVHQRRPPIEIEARLLSLPAPSWAAFDNWRSFNCHLKSLESFLPKLRSIEADDQTIAFEG